MQFASKICSAAVTGVNFSVEGFLMVEVLQFLCSVVLVMECPSTQKFRLSNCCDSCSLKQIFRVSMAADADRNNLASLYFTYIAGAPSYFKVYASFCFVSALLLVSGRVKA